ncbi:MAG: DUF4296 domain-containing protein [Bacteroidales bacterium]|nr:DUF4296 domain-containing protein [Bacteroidales bacterium]
MKKLIFINLIWLLSCSSGNNEQVVAPPENIIPKDKMVELLVDVQLIEAAIKSDDTRKKDSKTYSTYYYTFLFEKYNTTKEDFIESLRYYQQNIDDFDQMYTEVIKRLSKFQSEIELE